MCGLLALRSLDASAQTIPAPSPVFSVQDLKDDLRIAKSALEEGDPGLYRFASKQTIDGQFHKASESVDRAMTELEVFRILAPAVASIKNGHTQLHLSDALAKRLAQQPAILPLYVRILDGRPYVLRDLSGGDRPLVGAKILAVNGVAANTIVQRIEASLSLDADIRPSRDRDAGGLGFGRGLVRMIGLESPFDLVVSLDGKTRTVRVDGITEEAFADRRLGAAKDRFHGGAVGPALPPTGLTFRDDGVAVLRIAHWDSADDGGRDLTLSFPGWFAELAARKTGSLIIDIRDNGGGEETAGTALLSYLVDERFSYYDCAVLNNVRFDFLRYLQDDGTPYATLLPQYAKAAQGACRARGAYELTNRPNLGPQQPRAPYFAGRVYLLINAGSFSTSSEFAANLRSHAHPTLIGEETSGAYYGNDSGITVPIVLPHSKLVLEVPTVAYFLAVKHDLPRNSGVLPDNPISYDVRELLARADKEMDAALALIKKKSTR